MAKEKLSPIPRASKKKPAPASVPPAIQPSVAPDLTQIVEQLRPLAVPIGDLQFDPTNARTHPEPNLDAIKGSLTAYGQRTPVVVNRRTGHLAKGNGTLQAALSLGWQYLAAVYVDEDPARATGYSLADNRAGELAGWDREMLDKLLRDVNTDNDPRLDAMLAELSKQEALYKTDPTPAPEPQIDRAAELQKKWGTERGQLWEIPSKSVSGKCHRLVCGDSTKTEDVERVMNGERAGLMNTDPPYGVSYANDDRPNPGVAKPRVAKPRVAKDELRDEALQRFLEQAFSLAVTTALVHNAAWYLWHAHLTQGFFAAAAAAAAAANVVLHRQLIWKKSNMLLTRGQYHWKHEPCFMGWVEGHQPPDYGRGNGERDQTTVWEVDSVTQADRKEFNHATPKPVGLFTVPLVKHLKPGEIAYEPFAGSGPQFCAAEQLARLCYGIEISPAYTAVCLERLAGMGLEPRLVGRIP